MTVETMGQVFGQHRTCCLRSLHPMADCADGVVTIPLPVQLPPKATRGGSRGRLRYLCSYCPRERPWLSLELPACAWLHPGRGRTLGSELAEGWSHAVSIQCLSSVPLSCSSSLSNKQTKKEDKFRLRLGSWNYVKQKINILRKKKLDDL